MSIKVSKYEFNSKEQAQEKIDALKVEVENENGDLELVAQHRHTIVELGNIVLEQGQYDDDGNEVVAPILSDKYHLDVLWKDLEEHPYGWKSYAIDLDNEGSHGFLGISYLANKM